MKNWNDKKRLAEQLKFFGAKKRGFISCYAKKPRIKVAIEDPFKVDVKFGEGAIRACAAFKINQMALVQASMLSPGQSYLASRQARQQASSSFHSGTCSTSSAISGSILGGLI